MNPSSPRIRRTAAAVREADVDPLLRELRALRRAQELTLAEVAQRTGARASGHFSRLELGYTQPQLSTLRAWAAALGYDLALVPLRTTDG